MIYDISPLISQSLAVFPGDMAYQRTLSSDMNHGDSITLSSIQATLHLGAHADAPSHYTLNGEGIHARPLNSYMGKCQVISVSIPRGQRITAKHLGPEYIGNKILAERVLFKTRSFPDPNTWNDDFNTLSPELIELLFVNQVILIGIDTPSIDPADDKVLPAHGAVARCNMAVLEGLVLDEVPDGVYTLVALPLKLKDADSSPVRAVLLQSGALKG